MASKWIALQTAITKVIDIREPSVLVFLLTTVERREIVTGFNQDVYECLHNEIASLQRFPAVYPRDDQSSLAYTLITFKSGVQQAVKETIPEIHALIEEALKPFLPKTMP